MRTKVFPEVCFVQNGAKFSTANFLKHARIANVVPITIYSRATMNVDILFLTYIKGLQDCVVVVSEVV